MIRISYEGYTVGRLSRLESGGARLDYDERWLGTASAFPVSLSLPLGAEPLEGPEIEAWLWNLLPSGPALATIAEALGADADDPLALIARLGADAPGGLVFAAADTTPGARQPRLRPIPNAEALERLLSVWDAHPLLAGDPEIAMTHGRAAPWISVVADEDGALALPLDAAAGTHWLEPEDPRRPGRLENRAFCLELARLCGLHAAVATPGAALKRRYLLIERSDRREGRDGARIRLHQEDLAQAAGRRPSEAHQLMSADGLGFAEIFAIADAQLSATDRLRLLDAAIFRALIGDVDADGKSAALTLTGGVRLAPFQEAAALGPWPRRERRLRQRFDARRLRPDQLRGADWRALARSCGLNPTFTGRRVTELAEAIAEQGPEATARLSDAPALNAPIVAYFERDVIETSRRVAANASR